MDFPAARGLKSVKRDGPALMRVAARCLLLRCPVCGGASIIERPFQVRHHCSSCGALFKREDGFFVGAIMANVMMTELVILAVYLVSLPLFSFDDRLVIKFLVAIALLFPALFYHHSWSIWLGFDHLVEKLPKYVEEGRGPKGGARR